MAGVYSVALVSIALLVQRPLRCVLIATGNYSSADSNKREPPTRHEHSPLKNATKFEMSDLFQAHGKEKTQLRSATTRNY
jgi:hypothetical protein